MSDQRFFNHRDTQQKTDQPRRVAQRDPARRLEGDRRGSDPYNTSGSFDRKQHWARVGKR